MVDGNNIAGRTGPSAALRTFGAVGFTLAVGAMICVWVAYEHRARAEEAAVAELKTYHLNGPVVSARKLQAEFDADPAAARQRYDGKRYVVYGRIVLAGPPDPQHPGDGGWVTVTTGTGDGADLGNKVVQLIAPQPWGEVIGSLPVGSYVAANCTLQLSNLSEGTTLIGYGCNSVAPGLGDPRKPVSPFGG